MKRVPAAQLSLFPEESESYLETQAVGKNMDNQNGKSDEPWMPAAHEALFQRLLQSTFRSRFHLKAADVNYIREKGMETISRHAHEMVARRLAPADLPNDGKQTPMNGHPVFIAQHATACCCRGCLEKWHHIPAGHVLSEKEQEYVVSVLMTWIRRELLTIKL